MDVSVVRLALNAERRAGQAANENAVDWKEGDLGMPSFPRVSALRVSGSFGNLPDEPVRQAKQ